VIAREVALVERSGRRELLVSKGWVQAVALVVLFGFFVLGLLAYRTYTGQPPIPERVVDPEGNVVYTGEDVTAKRYSCATGLWSTAPSSATALIWDLPAARLLMGAGPAASQLRAGACRPRRAGEARRVVTPILLGIDAS
jgi:hypothetical protein